MAGRQFHVGWFVDGFHPPSWNTTYDGSASRDWADGHFFVDLARAAERACMDFVLVADANYVPDVFGGNHDWALRYGRTAPLHDPVPLVPVMADHTRHIGFLPTLSVTEWRPYALARYLATADHMSGGRVGWNLVTSSNDRAAQNFGFEAQPAHDERYDIADEFAQVVRKLWGSWEPDSVVLDHDSGVYGIGSKVHAVEHRGKYFSSRGPLTTLPPFPGGPVISQAGASSRGQSFAAQHADIVVTSEASVEGLKRYRASLDAKMVELGRSPQDCKLFVLATPVIADTDAEAREHAERWDDEARIAFELRVAQMSSHWGIDLSELDWDQPFPKDLTTNGHQGVLDAAIASRQTVRELLGGTRDRATTSKQTVGMFGTPTTVAGQLCDIVDEVGADGVLILKQTLDRRFVAEVTDGLMPALQRRGATRDGYSHTTLRENLFAF